MRDGSDFVKLYQSNNGQPTFHIYKFMNLNICEYMLELILFKVNNVNVLIKSTAS